MFSYHKMPNSFRSFFPIFQNNSELVFLDSAASAQKPRVVIDGMKDFLEHDYANIHRGAYELSERSEELYHASKEITKKFLNASSSAEINYTYNATYAFNLLSSSMRESGWLKKWDKVLLSIVEHHANIVPWLHLKETIGIEVEFIGVTPDYQLDLGDLRKKLTPEVKVLSLTYASNVTGSVFDLTRVRELLDIMVQSGQLTKKPLFVIDASQAVPHFSVDVQALDCDFLVFTGHKVMAETGIGVLYGKKELLKMLTPAFCGGGAINWVHTDEYQPAGLPYRFEPGTPNISGAVSLLRAFEFIESIWGYDAVEKQEKDLMAHATERYIRIKDGVRLIGSERIDKRTGIFSFHVPGIHIADLLESFAEEGIALRAGHHCAEPFMQSIGIGGTLRVSLYLYNTQADIDRFFDVFEKILQKLS